MTIRKLGFAVVILLGGCAAPSGAGPAMATQACPVGGSQMAKVELYVGLAIPGGGEVSEAAWLAFLDTEITPRFPGGLSVSEVSGQWRDAATGGIVREPARRVMILYERSANAEAAIEAIRAAYKTRFRQDSVMRLDETECVAF